MLQSRRSVLAGLRQLSAAGALLGLGFRPALAADERGTPEEAEALVNRAVELVKKDGDKAYPILSDATGPYRDRDLYVVVLDPKGNLMAHGANKALVGKNLWDAEDPDGVKFIQEIRKMAAAKPDGGWVKFKFTHPVTKKIEAKVMFVRSVGDMAVACGAYPKDS